MRMHRTVTQLTQLNMTRYFTFNSESEAEAFCTQGCPIYGTDLKGNEVQDKGITTRLADWIKHPKLEKWLVRVADMPGETKGTIEEFDEEIIYPRKNSLTPNGI